MRRRLGTAMATCAILTGVTTPLQLWLIAGVPATPTAVFTAVAIAFVCLLLFFLDRTIDGVVERGTLKSRVLMVLIPATTVVVMLLPGSSPFWVAALVGMAAGVVLSVSFLGAVYYLLFTLSAYGAASVAATSLANGLLTFGLVHWAAGLPLWAAVSAGVVMLVAVLAVLLLVVRLLWLPSLGRRQWPTRPRGD